MEGLQGNPTFSVLFLLVFFAISTWVERFEKKGRIRPVLKKIPWDTLWKVFVYWAAVLFLRKLLYYNPVEGVVQTKDSVWWADTNVSYFLYGAVCVLGIPLVIVIKSNLRQFLIKNILNRFPKFFKEKKGTLAVDLVKAGGVIVSIFLFLFIDHNSFLWEFIIRSLLPIKVICSGKYLGLLTAFLLAYYIAAGYKRLKKITIAIKKTKLQANVIVIPGLFLIFLILTPVRFTAGWDQKFTSKLSEAQLEESVKKFEDLVDAVNSIKNEQHLKKAAVAISKAGAWQWALEVTKTIKDIKVKLDALEQIFVITIRSGNRDQSEAVLQEMFGFVMTLEDIDKFRALKKIEQLTFKTGNTTWILKIIQKEVLAAVRIEDPKERVKALIKIAADIAAIGYKNRVKETFQQAIEQVKNIRYQKDQSLMLKEVALAIAKTGDTQWAEVVAEGIANKGMKNRALAQIRKWIKEK